MIGNSNHRIKYLRGDDEFPPLSEARSNGLLAAGGSLSVARLLKAYSSGIFPWYDEWSPILWYSPPERCIIEPSAMVRTKSLRQRIRNGGFKVSFDTDFESVIRACAQIERSIGDGTWIVPEMILAYKTLHAEGYAHSVEVWEGDNLVGGLYGVSIGKAFFGESMFHRKTDASKVALHYLCNLLEMKKFFFIDAQMKTSHLMSLGATIITREQYLLKLQEALSQETLKGSWTNLLRE
ncbi:MAG: leucyl/phenylalanyl-tRNA--protein transferase [Lentimicrobium sp.]|nr:leucyl/phenylalanyl-tRNA--protein transferase [Lentimicrobium sp.]